MSLSNSPEDANKPEPGFREDQPSPPERAEASGGFQLLLVLAVAVGAGAALFFFRRASEDDSFQRLATLSLTPVADEGLPLALSDLQGQVVLINFWGTWCPPCLKELPDIVAVQKKFGHRKDFRLLAVSCGAREEDEEPIEKLRRATQAFLDQRGLDLPAYVDPDGVTRRAVAQASGLPELPGYPTTVLLDRDQRVRMVWRGAQTFGAFDGAIQSVLNED